VVANIRELWNMVKNAHEKPANYEKGANGTHAPHAERGALQFRETVPETRDAPTPRDPLYSSISTPRTKKMKQQKQMQEMVSHWKPPLKVPEQPRATRIDSHSSRSFKVTSYLFRKSLHLS